MTDNRAPYYDTLMPDNTELIIESMEEGNRFRELNEISKFHADFSHIKPSKMTSGKHSAYFKSLDARAVVEAKMLSETNPGFECTEELLGLLNSVITDEIDKELRAYLGSNFAVMSFGVRVLTSESRVNNPSIKWHCDSAPINSAMLICYLDNDEDHSSSTLFLTEDTTAKLKDVGYIYSKVVDRHENIDDMLDYYQLDNTVERHPFVAGESVIFSAARIAHRAQVPREGTQRMTLDIAIIPSPVPWKEAINRGYTPGNAYADYAGQVERLLSCVNTVSDKPKDKIVIKVSRLGSINSEESLKFHLDSIFSDKGFSNRLFLQIKDRSINYDTLTIDEFIIYLKKHFKMGLNWESKFEVIDVNNISDLINYEKKYTNSIVKFSSHHKPARAEVMWPIPNHDKYPKSKYEMTPYVNEHKIMDKSTPIGSAGSCFAVEIAEILQAEEFNYVVTELGDKPKEEAIIDGYEVGSGKAMYSANFGILFNTPSLRQISEKAFGEREFTKYLVDAEHGLLMDPYRENVYFSSKENFLRDYPKHINAIKQVLLQSEVFIFTAGLNECWQLFDGTVISRNPRGGFYHLIEHKVLTVQENVDNIMSFFNMVKRHNPKFKLVLTLSPVPLLATGRGDTHHIIEANTHSKAVLKVALEEVVKLHKDIYYLPSYELVTECTQNPWDPDHRHVTRDTVSRVVSMFKDIFVED
ncbi:MAG: GSCFA domain-containing protein [Colwellia sp.]|jgi:GSCFA family.